MNSRESKAVHNYYILKEGIKQSPKEIADCLMPLNVLSQEDCDYLRNPHHDVGQKARRIVDAISQQEKTNPSTYYDIIDAIEKLPWAKSFIHELEQECPRKCIREEKEEDSRDILDKLEVCQKKLSEQQERLQKNTDQLEKECNKIPLTFEECEILGESLDSLRDEWTTLTCRQKEVVNDYESLKDDCFHSIRCQADSCYETAEAKQKNDANAS